MAHGARSYISPHHLMSSKVLNEKVGLKDLLRAIARILFHAVCYSVELRSKLHVWGGVSDL